MNGAGRIGMGGGDSKPRPGKVPDEVGCYGDVMAARPRTRRVRTPSRT